MQNIETKKRKVAEKAQELEQAKMKGDTKKISKKERKLADAEKELQYSGQQIPDTNLSRSSAVTGDSPSFA